MEMIEKPICKNQAEIAAYIGVDKRSIIFLIENHRLPVFQIAGKGKYKALKTSLYEWLKGMEKENLL